MAPVRTATRARSEGRHSSIGPMTDSPGEAARFLTRNAVDALPEGELERQLAKGRPLRVKLGVDPTTPDIHLGHTVVLRKLREFQDLGHTVVLIIGDYTGRVGDPSGRSATRPVRRGRPRSTGTPRPTRSRPSRCSTATRTEVRRNGEWLDMPMEDLFRLARTSTVAQLLERDDFAKRYAGGEPISILELLYPLLQGYDSVAIRVRRRARRHRPEVQPAPRARDTEGLRRGAAVDPHDADPAGDRRRAEDVEVARQLRGRGRPARGDVREADAGAGRRDADLLRAAAGRADPPGRPARRQAAHGPRSDRALPRRGGGRRRRSASTRSTCAASCPTRSRSSPSAPRTGRCTCPR